MNIQELTKTVNNYLEIAQSCDDKGDFAKTDLIHVKLIKLASEINEEYVWPEHLENSEIKQKFGVGADEISNELKTLTTPFSEKNIDRDKSPYRLWMHPSGSLRSTPEEHYFNAIKIKDKLFGPKHPVHNYGTYEFMLKGAGYIRILAYQDNVLHKYNGPVHMSVSMDTNVTDEQIYQLEEIEARLMPNEVLIDMFVPYQKAPIPLHKVSQAIALAKQIQAKQTPYISPVQQFR